MSFPINLVELRILLMQDIKRKKDTTVLRTTFFKLNFAGLVRDNGRGPTLVYVIQTILDNLY
jgi:hypothetical protein